MIRTVVVALLCGIPLTALAQPRTWNYSYADQQYGRHKSTFTVRADPATEEATGRYLAKSLDGGKTLLEYLPYALAAGEPPAAWPPPSGYPTYATPYLEWMYVIKVVGWESVTVPAGTFRALRVDIEGRRGKDPDPFWWPKQAARFQHSVWYAPDAKRYVKARHRAWSMSSALFADDLVELLEIRAD
jgi:hypothetical protein